MFEVFRRNLGRDRHVVNEEELTTCTKIWGQEVGRRGKGEHNKNGPVQEQSPAANRTLISSRPV
jgi:hypothetical protein